MDKAQYNLCFDNNQTCGDVFFRFEKEALVWMRDNIHGTPVVADAPVDYYRESGGMVATYTGLPICSACSTRASSAMTGRWASATATPRVLHHRRAERARIMIAKYDIQYIYIGQVARICVQEYRRRDVEVRRYGPGRLAGSGSIRTTAVTIYHVKPQTTQPGQGITPGQPRPSPDAQADADRAAAGDRSALVALEAAVRANPTDIGGPAANWRTTTAITRSSRRRWRSTRQS